MELRNNKHESFLNAMDNKQMYKNEMSGDVNKWPHNTILITRDSILNNIQENRLQKNFSVKVRAFTGANICDMNDYIAPLLRKELEYIFLHIGCNDAVSKNSDE